MQFRVGQEESDLVVGEGLSHGHVVTAGIEESPHGAVTEQIAHHDDAVGIEQAIKDADVDRGIDECQQVLAIWSQVVIGGHPDVVIALYPIELGLQNPDGKGLVLQLRFV